MYRKQFRIKIRCTYCDALGTVTWEENIHAGPQGPQRRLVQVHGNFHAETGRTASGDPLIVCNECDTIQPD